MALPLHVHNHALTTHDEGPGTHVCVGKAKSGFQRVYLCLCWTVDLSCLLSIVCDVMLISYDVMRPNLR